MPFHFLMFAFCWVILESVSIYFCHIRNLPNFAACAKSFGYASRTWRIQCHISYSHISHHAISRYNPSATRTYVLPNYTTWWIDIEYIWKSWLWQFYEVITVFFSIAQTFIAVAWHKNLFNLILYRKKTQFVFLAVKSSKTNVCWHPDNGTFIILWYFTRLSSEDTLQASQVIRVKYLFVLLSSNKFAIWQIQLLTRYVNKNDAFATFTIMFDTNWKWSR